MANSEPFSIPHLSPGNVGANNDIVPHHEAMNLQLNIFGSSGLVGHKLESEIVAPNYQE